MKDLKATESRDIEETMTVFDKMERNLPLLLQRLRPSIDLQPGADVLDVGAAQGVTVAIYKRAGYHTRGVEPWVRLGKSAVNWQPASAPTLTLCRV